MKISIPINLSRAKLIFSQGEDNLNEIFQDDGDHLYITAFGYKLTEFCSNAILRYLQAAKDIIVVLSFPESDSDNDVKAEQLITNALKKNPYLQLYSCKNNYSKIMSNGKKVYVGSANASDMSHNNLETGVIFDDSQSIKEIEDQVFGRPYLKYESIFTDPIAPLMIPFILLLDEMVMGYAYSSFLNAFSNSPNRGEAKPVDFTKKLETSLQKYLKTFRTAQQELIKYGSDKSDLFFITNLMNDIEDSLISLISSVSDYKPAYEEENDEKEGLYITQAKAVAGKFNALRVMWISTFPQTNFIKFSSGPYSVVIWSEVPDLCNKYWNYFLK